MLQSNPKEEDFGDVALFDGTIFSETLRNVNVVNDQQKAHSELALIDSIVSIQDNTHRRNQIEPTLAQGYNTYITNASPGAETSKTMMAPER